jgi:hypothetical protein
MTYHMWRLSEAAPDNLGLACTDEGLLLGGTSLIEQREGRFVVRDRDEIERLLRCGHRYIGEADRLMPGLAAVARALNAGDQCLAHIAAVHLKLPDLPNRAARGDGGGRLTDQIRAWWRQHRLESGAASAHRHAA